VRQEGGSGTGGDGEFEPGREGGAEHCMQTPTLQVFVDFCSSDIQSQTSTSALDVLEGYAEK